MKKISFFIILALLLFPLISSPLLATTRGISVVSKHGQNLYLYKDYHALVIGISNYEKWPRLPNAVNDAKEVAAKLKEFGFEVRLVLDPTSREIKTVLSEMVYKMGREKNRALLFYYAGHGETEILADKTKMGYIIPRDCPLLEKDPMGFTTHAISMRDIESVSMRIRAKHVVMLFDSCFSGSLFSLVRAVPHDITEKSALPVRQYITAGREDEQVPDKSMFKRCFLIGLDGDADLTGDGYITGSELGMYLSDKVINYTHRRQHPQYGKINNPDLDRGDFIFALKAPLQPSTQISTAPSPSLETEKHSLAEERARLELERHELERLKMDIERKRLEAERKRLEVEKKKLDTAKLPSKQKYPPPVSAVSKGREIARDSRFIAYDNGTVLDMKTNLMWAAKDDGEGLIESAARDYIEKYRGGGYTDWRMPTMDELKTIYDWDMKNQHGYHVSKLIDIKGEWVWGSEEWSNINGFSFNEGSPAVGTSDGSSGWTRFGWNSARALPVRGGN